jgi:hypothetical protein
MASWRVPEDGPRAVNAHYGEDGLKNPTAEEWAALSFFRFPCRYRFEYVLASRRSQVGDLRADGCKCFTNRPAK